MSARVYDGTIVALPPDCEVCRKPGVYAAGFREDTSYRYMDRWIKSEVEYVAYFCREHLPLELSGVAAAREAA